MAIEQADAQDAAISGRARQRDGRRVLLPPVRWPAVLIGVAAGLLAELLLTMFGIASGASIAGMQRLGLDAFGPWLWTGLAMLLGALLAGYLAARLSGWRRKVDGILHGAVAWAVTTILFSVLATAVGGVLNVHEHGGGGGALQQQAPQQAPTATLQQMLHAQGIALDPQAAERLQQDVQAGRRDAATEDLVRDGGVDTARAATLVDQAAIALATPPQQPAPQPARGEDSATSAIAWGMLFAVALSLAIAMGGGALGAVGARHAATRGRGAF